MPSCTDYTRTALGLYIQNDASTAFVLDRRIYMHETAMSVSVIQQRPNKSAETSDPYML